jgi:hypothetical protein
MESKMTWIFKKFDTQKNGFLKKEEIQNLIFNLYSLSYFLEVDEEKNEFENIFIKIYKSLNKNNSDKIKLEDLNRTIDEIKEFNEFIMLYCSLILETRKFDEDAEKLDQVAGHSGGLKSIIN